MASPPSAAIVAECLNAASPVQSRQIIIEYKVITHDRN